MLGRGSQRLILPWQTYLVANVKRNVCRYEMCVGDESVHRPLSGAMLVTCVKFLQENSRYATLTYDEDDTTQQQGKDSLLNKWCGVESIAARKTKRNSAPTSYNIQKTTGSSRSKACLSTFGRVIVGV